MKTLCVVFLSAALQGSTVYPVTVVFFDGDSLTEGNRCDVPPWPTMLNLSPLLPSSNMAKGGATVYEQDQRAAGLIDTYALGREGQRWVILLGGGNDLYYGATASETIHRLELYAQHRKTAGFKVMLITVPPRREPTLPPTFEASRQQVNLWLRTKGQNEADAVVDLTGISELENMHAPDDAGAFCDGVHLGPQGAQAVAAAVGVAMMRQLGKALQ
jgi:lysophospholipase L1-like esterase